MGLFLVATLLPVITKLVWAVVVLAIAIGIIVWIKILLSKSKCQYTSQPVASRPSPLLYSVIRRT